MKIVCRKDILTEGINIVSKAVSNRTTMPILECILLTAPSEPGSGIRLLANDLELAIETKPIEAEIIVPGEIALEARVFFDIIRRLPGEDVYLEVMKNYITVIRGGVSEFRILGQAGGEFPLLPEVESEGGFEISSGRLKNMIRQTIFSVSTDESKPIMTGESIAVSGGRLRIASVDGFIMSTRYADIDNKEITAEAVVPGKSMSEINKILPQSDKSITSVYFSEKHATFETENAVIVSRLIEGNFMDINSVLQFDCTTYLTVEVAALRECLERATLISREATKNPVKISVLADDKLTVSCNTETGTFFEELSVEVDGQELEICFNPAFLLDILKAIEDERVHMMLTTPLSPCIIKGIEGDGYKYLVLPMRMQS